MIMKLKKCTINNSQAAQVMRNPQSALEQQEKSRLIEIISRQSSRYGDKLIDFMDTYRLDNLQSATVEQLRVYVATRCHQPQKTDDRML